MVRDPLALSASLPGWPLAVFRIAFGLLYLDMALQKPPWIRDELGRPFGWLAGFIEKEVADPAFAWYATFLEDVVLPHLAIFGWVVFLTELTLGIGLLFGLLTRLVGLIGFLWMLNISLQAFNVPGEWYWIWPLLILPHFCFAFSGAGRVLGVDRWLAPALRRRAETGAGWAQLLQYAT